MKLHLVILLCLLAVAHSRFIKRLIGGRNLERGTFNNVVRVIGRKGHGVLHIFHNGVIWNQKWIAVTAECIFGIREIVSIKNVRVVARRWNIANREEPEQSREVELTRQYSDTDNTELGKSINLGLLKLKRALIFSQLVSAISFSRNVSYPSGRGVMVGWGSTTIEDSESSRTAKIIQIVAVDIIPRDECVEAIDLMLQNRKFRSAKNFNRFNVCAGGFKPSFITEMNPLNFRGATHGDDGAPLMQMDENGEYKVIGIIYAGVPSVDLSVTIHVAPFFEWIGLQIAAFPDP